MNSKTSRLKRLHEILNHSLLSPFSLYITPRSFVTLSLTIPRVRKFLLTLTLKRLHEILSHVLFISLSLYLKPRSFIILSLSYVYQKFLVVSRECHDTETPPRNPEPRHPLSHSPLHASRRSIIPYCLPVLRRLELRCRSVPGASVSG